LAAGQYTIQEAQLLLWWADGTVYIRRPPGRKQFSRV